jgi:hypothetical protein
MPIISLACAAPPRIPPSPVKPTIEPWQSNLAGDAAYDVARAPVLGDTSLFTPGRRDAPPSWPAAVAPTPTRSRTLTHSCNHTRMRLSCTHARAHAFLVGQRLTLAP